MFIKYNIILRTPYRCFKKSPYLEKDLRIILYWNTIDYCKSCLPDLQLVLKQQLLSYTFAGLHTFSYLHKPINL